MSGLARAGHSSACGSPSGKDISCSGSVTKPHILLLRRGRFAAATGLVAPGTVQAPAGIPLRVTTRVLAQPPAANGGSWQPQCCTWARTDSRHGGRHVRGSPTAGRSPRCPAEYIAGRRSAVRSSTSGVSCELATRPKCPRSGHRARSLPGCPTAPRLTAHPGAERPPRKDGGKAARTSRRPDCSRWAAWKPRPRRSRSQHREQSPVYGKPGYTRDQSLAITRAVEPGSASMRSAATRRPLARRAR
jgi:hypothetical protein